MVEPSAPPDVPTFERSPRARREGDDGLAPPPGGFAALHGRIVAMSGKLMGGGRRRRRSGSLYDRWENRRSVAARGDRLQLLRHLSDASYGKYFARNSIACCY